MIFSIHYLLIFSGICAASVLLGVFLIEYTDASEFEVGLIFVAEPIIGILTRPYFCSLADRQAAHKKYLCISLWLTVIGYLPFVLIPLTGKQIYGLYPRLNLYIFALFKLIGSTGSATLWPLGDSLTINYANQTGTDFSAARKWGTVSWGLFSLVIGQINEVSFLPKYVAGFIILLSSSLFEITLVWLWPDEYFIIISSEEAEKRSKQFAGREMMSNSEILAHMRKKLITSLKALPRRVCCCFPENDDINKIDFEKEVKSLEKCKNDNHLGNYTQQQIVPDITGEKDIVISKDLTISKLAKINLSKQQSNDADSNNKSSLNGKQISDLSIEKSVDSRTQIVILTKLLREDPRIAIFILVFIAGGMICFILQFFFIQLKEICETTGDCNFSALAGYTQLGSAITETIYFLFVTKLMKTMGKINLLAFAFFLSAARFLIAANYIDKSAYWSLLTEATGGVVFITYIVMLTEMAYEFSSQIALILPSLFESNKLERSKFVEARLILVLTTTMQALFSSAFDGIGRSIGSLLAGFIIDSYSFNILWTIAGIFTLIVGFTLIIGNLILSKCLKLKPRIKKLQEKAQNEELKHQISKQLSH